MKTIKEFEKKYNIRLCLNHTGKMSGMISLSTACSCNEYCKAHSSVNGSICQHCYAERMMKMYNALEKKLMVNTEALTKEIIPTSEMPTLNCLYFRFEAFGDLNNYIQVVNYFNLCKANKAVHFALWTKNPHIIQEAINKGYKKPSNLVILVSSIFVNKIGQIRYDFIDKVFTVYDKKFAEENGIEINCGARNCLACHRCYKKTKEVEYINELLK